jgi:hypothetical protein
MKIDSEILLDPRFKAAVSAIQRRAERQVDFAKLVDIFVATDLFIRAQSTDTQLIMGRRGTGKTHMIKVVAHNQRFKGDTVLLIDCTQLGSGYSGLRNVEPYEVAAKYFTALLNQISTDLLDAVIGMENPDPAKQEILFNKLTALATYVVVNAGNRQSTFNYRQITDSINQVLDGLGVSRLFLLLDEWAQVPIEAQPHFAEFIKRALLPVNRMSLKILAVNYQCEFFQTIDGQPIGIQRGADVTDVIDIDTYLVYDEKRSQVIKFFAQVLYNHLGAELGWDLSVDTEQKESTVESLFTQSGAFIQLVRAAEGNCRDFLCIFSRAYYDGFLHTQAAKKISVPNIEKASGSWFETEKESNIKVEPNVQAALAHIFEKVIKGYKSRTFMVEASKAYHPILLRLLNERILHKLNILYSHRDKPGIRYELFTLDFGSYVRFKDTANEPYQLFLVENDFLVGMSADEKKHMVPLDDRRSIRRIVFNPDTLQTEA